MYLVDFHRIESLKKNNTHFNAFVSQYIQNHEVDETIRLLKLAGIGIQEFREEEKIKNDQVYIDLIENHYGNVAQIENWKRECSIINILFNDLTLLRAAQGVDDVPIKRQLIGYLIVLEIFLGSILAYLNGLNLQKIKETYPFVVSLIDVPKQKILPANKDITQLHRIMDSIAENAGTLLKYFFREGSKIDLNTTVNYEQIKVLREHASLIDKYDIISNLEEKWSMMGLDINAIEDTIEIKLNDEEANKVLALSSARFQSQRRKWSLDFKNSDKSILESKIESNNSQLAPDGFISEAEAFYGISLGEFLSAKDLKMKLKNVEIREWLRAYSVIYREMDAVIAKRMEQCRVNPLLLKSWCSVKHKDEWIALFTDCGISVNSASIIIENLTFNRKSKDLLDRPFIPSGDLLIVIPSLALMIDPAMSTISNMASNTSDIALKGTGLERETLEKLRNANISCNQIKTTVGKEIYECDVFFVLDDVLFFVECKAFGQPNNVRQIYELMLKIKGPDEEIFPRATNDRSATEQLNRIADFYMENLNLISEKLGLKNDWKPRTVVRLILTTAMMGENVSTQGCYVIDNSTFSRFIKRDAPSMIVGPYTVQGSEENYEGEITFNKFMNVMTDSPQIRILANRTNLSWNQLDLQNHKLKYNHHTVPAAEMLKFDREDISEMIKRGILPEDAMEHMFGANRN
ncbi:hypothetical protein [Paenibacillus sp. FSL H8-0034]|uniref:hypothetical protein n=1 Tax=Paenibacillus sp. FSL H8-0034 TaxID=2954671 RepID=UPI0030F721BE